MPAMRTFVALLLLLPLTACVERTISITSTPSGALVHLNDQEVGRTPLTVPFTYYGVYDVRLEHEPALYNRSEARQLLGVDDLQLQAMIDRGEIGTETERDETYIRLAFKPNWTSAEAKAPFWEHPGPDLVAEAMPDRRVNIDWHFELEPRPVVNDERLIDRAKQMRALTNEMTPGEADDPNADAIETTESE